MIEPYLTNLPYQPDAVLNIFAPLSIQPWAILLHSSNTNHVDGNFDILVAKPIVTLVTNNGVTKICNGTDYLFSKTDPFILIQQELEKMQLIVQPNKYIPFQGGAVGLFSYDLVRYFETLPRIAQRDLNLPDMAVGIYRWALIADHARSTLTLVSYEEPSKILASLMHYTTSYNTTIFRLHSSWVSNMTRANYGEKFRKIQQFLQDGDCYQVCLAQRFSATCSGDEWLAFRHLVAYNSVPFAAFIRLNQQTTVLSFSPERFLRLRENIIESRPIKGTIPRLLNVEEDRLQAIRLAASSKDMAENLMIVDLLRNDIGKVALPGSVQVPSLFAIETFPQVYHMVSTITGTLSPHYSACDLIRACFPGGSVVGAPKVQAMKMIEQLEPQCRSAWCGSIGYLSYCGTMDTNITIRTLIIDHHKIYCSVGGGIIADSDEETEYQETLAKAATLLPLLE
ncbi:aminodeoxychorismate synthase component I [Candidatus Palibaumannia cicadellinicola]|uniref:aminodeoxychorismate synthase n=1 Tax=Baumannia cicadellinicola subsp. Homalodisca coagulata TaxID=374463 RepID=Q1LT20_BAUCH|nr:aminodeoxychorismate synthase component I [Candidatus Baumannia cicadellinicola]ABF14011.1 para-aminobenzoate synthase, component I [Baumannia cicadellinicola str. Hc (Homalodisca coagulata)]MCJ7462068.1 aminodeoxychorismate synthase component I [Candidatus Baumannia cicadellinicola]MCJ7462651.1 aminodeoxychorismate synthase component I [Candidatus Baumannia cicadellinicola]